MKARLKRRIPEVKITDPGKTRTPVLIGPCSFDPKLTEIAEESILGEMAAPRESVLLSRHQLVKLVDHVTEPMNPKLVAVIDAINRLSLAETYMIGAGNLGDAIRAWRGFTTPKPDPS